MFRSTLSKSRSKLFPSKTKEKEEEVLDVHNNTNNTNTITNNTNGPKTPILDGYKENTTVEENDDEDFGSFSYDDDHDEYFSESDVEVSDKRGGAEEKKYSRLEKFRRSRSRSRSPSRSLSRSRSRSESKSRWEEEEAEAESVRRGGKKSGRSDYRTSSVLSCFHPTSPPQIENRRCDPEKQKDSRGLRCGGEEQVARVWKRLGWWTAISQWEEV